MACLLVTTRASFLQTPLASHSSTNNNNSSSSNKNQNPKPGRRINGSPSPSSSSSSSKILRKQPSIAQVQRAIGVTEDPLGFDNNSSNSSVAPTSFLDLLSSTPIGQLESPAERKIREVAEWVVDQTESNARAGQQVLLVTCLKILPVWLFLLLIASGVVKLPFDLPFMEDLIS